MKKFRMIMPMLAFVFAMVGAVAGDFLPGITAYYKVDAVTCNSGTTQQNDCRSSSDTQYPLCTILVNGSPQQAFKNSDCTGILRNVPQE